MRLTLVSGLSEFDFEVKDLFVEICRVVDFGREYAQMQPSFQIRKKKKRRLQEDSEFMICHASENKELAVEVPTNKSSESCIGTRCRSSQRFKVAIHVSFKSEVQ